MSPRVQSRVSVRTRLRRVGCESVLEVGVRLGWVRVGWAGGGAGLGLVQAWAQSWG